MSGEQSRVTAPTKVCPHCGAQAQTLAKKCPHCGKGYKRRTLLKVFVGLCVVGLIFVIGCSALIASGVNELTAQQERHAITGAEFDQIELGMTQQQVRQVTGKEPQSRQDLEMEGILDDEPTTSSCIYYNQADGEWLDVYQLCFDDNRLTAKNSW